MSRWKMFSGQILDVVSVGLARWLPSIIGVFLSLHRSSSEINSKANTALSHSQQCETTHSRANVYSLEIYAHCQYLNYCVEAASGRAIESSIERNVSVRQLSGIWKQERCYFVVFAVFAVWSPNAPWQVQSIGKAQYPLSTPWALSSPLRPLVPALSTGHLLSP